MLDKETLRSLRTSRGLTGRQVAEGIGIAYPVYQTYESGVRNAGLPVVEKLADFYGVTTDYLLGREEQPNPLALLNLNFKNLDLTADEIFNTYDKMPDTVKAIVIDVLIRIGESAKNAQKKTAPKSEQQGNVIDIEKDVKRYNDSEQDIIDGINELKRQGKERHEVRTGDLLADRDSEKTD